MRVLWIGYGKMGRPMCRRVAAQGHALYMYDVAAARRAEATVDAIDLVSDLAATAEEADVVVTSLPHDAACRDALIGATGILCRCRPGSVLVETSTISVAASRDIAEVASSQSVDYLRAPVSGTVGAADMGKLSTFVSGDEGVVERVAPILAAYANAVIPVGGGEAARVVKLAVNLMVHTLMVSLGEAHALCRKGGVRADLAMTAICRSAIASPHLELKADSLLRADFTPTFTISQTRKDLRLVNEAARDLGVPVLLGATVEQILAAAESTGLGELDYIAHGKLIADMAGL